MKGNRPQERGMEEENEDLKTRYGIWIDCHNSPL
jgi:hypothetical protein